MMIVEQWINQIIHGDSLEIMPNIQSNSIDAIITDPPFAFTGGISNGRSSQTSDQFFAHWWRMVCKELGRILKPEASGFIWCDWKTAKLISDGFQPKDQTYNHFRISQMLYHYREMPGQGTPFRSSIDMIAYLRGPKHKEPQISKTTHNFISKYWYYGKHQYHPAEKSPEIVRQFIEWCSKEGDTIIDIFGGSGVVAVEAERMKRKYVVIEIDEDYAEIARKRVKAEAKQFTVCND